MQTSMQEMIQNIIDIESKTYNQEQLYMLTSLKVTALMLFKKEKEQIENAYWASYKEGQYSGDKTAKEYYDETYFQNK